MIYAMLSIGVLGFIVWGQTNAVALLYREKQVINSTIGWDGLTVVSTFYSKNGAAYAQSAGNRYISTIPSETTRGSSFFIFRESYLAYFGKPFLACDNWLYWLVGFIDIPKFPNLTDGWLSGFTDAEGCFNVTIDYKKNLVKCLFILDQKNSELEFNLIQKLFDKGKVSLRSTTRTAYGVYRYTLVLTTTLCTL